ncbi:Ubiquitin family protein [Trichomonas vaginalis G3]|uniref:Ubiquitin family protein n=1 Tax=Trichomonas vaginalis (strain ATCC PRA-98 / G3) TaxID=412133 RepID=A2FSJ6_TRIV3|nr:cellular macromolecule catabolic process [Trichomonas vaginalis G3]EAX92125.1 Ubiquitin family protein [Trichomonas vaginalis G3]KAI5488555.1 cellular macromolecule catabolic process [Trichomonas vaginalis G3]|eukprot:XP_001305055.1 Ubiquitin family protein [Trichomonas vaginalis G3]
MQVLIKKIIGNPVAYEIDNYDRVEDIKAKIQAQEGVPLNQQDLIYSGMRLINGSTIQDYSLKRNDTIHLIIRMTGF